MSASEKEAPFPMHKQITLQQEVSFFVNVTNLSQIFNLTEMQLTPDIWPKGFCEYIFCEPPVHS